MTRGFLTLGNVDRRRLSPICLMLAAGGLCLGADDPDAVCRRALELQQAGNDAGAATAYGECLLARPTASELRANYGVVLVHLGRYQEAIAQYREVLEHATGDPRLRYNLVLAYYKSGDVSKAAQELEGLHAQHPEMAQVTLLLADCYLRLGELPRTIALLEPLEPQLRNDKAFAYLLGMALIRGGNVARGQAVVDVILRESDSAEAHLLLGNAAFAKQDFPAAIDELRKAVAINPALPSAQSLYGQSLLNAGDPDAAATAFQKELASDPNDYESNVKLGAILSVRRKYAEALPLLEHALLVRPNSTEAHRELATVYAGLGRNADAERESAAGGPWVRETAGLLAPGSKAPPFSLSAHGSGKPIKLAELLAGGPVAVVFGSYTCPRLRSAAPALNTIAEKYRHRLRFVMIYVQEAHSDADWQSTINQRDAVALPPAKTMAEKNQYAATCIRKLGIGYPVAVDDMNRKVETAYAAWPSAVYLLAKDGTVIWNSRLDEQQFSAEEMEREILKLGLSAKP